MKAARARGIKFVSHVLECSTHGGAARWWCRECCEPLCAACLASNKHKSHQAPSVAQEAPRARHALARMLSQAASRWVHLNGFSYLVISKFKQYQSHLCL